MEVLRAINVCWRSELERLHTLDQASSKIDSIKKANPPVPNGRIATTTTTPRPPLHPSLSLPAPLSLLATLVSLWSSLLNFVTSCCPSRHGKEAAGWLISPSISARCAPVSSPPEPRRVPPDVIHPLTIPSLNSRPRHSQPGRRPFHPDSTPNAHTKGSRGPFSRLVRSHFAQRHLRLDRPPRPPETRPPS